MPMIRVTKQTSASTKSVWALLSDFANIDFFNPNLSDSYLLNGDNQEIGVGTLRQCNLEDGKNHIREKIIDWQPGSSYTVDIYEGTMPVDNSITKLGSMPSASGGSLVYMDFSYTPRYGFIGKIMNVIMMKRMLSGLLQKVVNGLAEKAELAEREQAKIAA